MHIVRVEVIFKLFHRERERERAIESERLTEISIVLKKREEIKTPNPTVSK